MKKFLFILACFLFFTACNVADLGTIEPEINESEIYFDGGKDEAKKRDRDAIDTGD